jgi:5'-3' exonuclease
MPNSKLTLLIDGNWLLMSRLSVLQNRYSDDEKLCKDLKLLMIRSINIVLKQFTDIDNIIFVSDGGSWRNKIPIPSFLQEEYKGTRHPDESINWEMIFDSYEDFIAKLRASGITVCKEPNLEGDDWIWYWSDKLNSEGTNVMIWSRDKDLTQLVKIDKDCCFTICWSKDSGVITVHRDEEEMDFFFNEAYSVNEQLYHSILDKAKDFKEINPHQVVVDKIIRGDAGDNVLPIIVKKSKTDKVFRVSQKDIDINLDYNDYEEYEAYIINLLNQKSYKDKVDKPLEQIIEHFEYNRRLVALQRDSYPPEILEIFDEYKTYNISKDTHEVEYQLIAEANSISSILDIV